MTKTITCPSGLSGEIRGLQGKNLGLLDDKKLMRSALFADEILKHCWVRTIDPGPYQMDEDGKLDWQKVLSGDRFYATLEIHCLMRGPSYEFPVDCNITRDCKRFQWVLDLQKLPVTKLSPESRKAFLEGGLLESTFRDGTRFWSRMPIGEDEVRAAKFGKGAKTLIPKVASRIVGIDGVEEGGVRRYLEEGDINLAFEALEAMAEHDCGVQTSFEVECPECGDTKEVQIPFDHLFLASSRPKKSSSPTDS